MIERLTKEQEAKFSEYVERGKSIGLCTDPANRSEAEHGVRLAYEAGGLPEPEIVWCGSPLGNVLTQLVFKKMASKNDSVLDSVRNNVRDSVCGGMFDSVCDSVWNSVYDNVQDSVEYSGQNSVWNSVRDSIFDNVHDSVLDSANSVCDSVYDSVHDSVWNSVCDSVWNNVYNSVWDSVHNSVRSSVWNSMRDGMFDSVHYRVWNSVLNSVWFNVRNSVLDSVFDIIWYSLWDSVRNSMGDSMGSSAWHSVRDSVLDGVFSSVYYSVRDSVRDSVWNSVQGITRENLDDHMRKSVSSSGYGQHDASWLIFYEFFRNECGLKEETENLVGLLKMAENAGWFLPCENVCFISERHNECHLVDDKIHNEHGPAIAYPDGFKVYGLNGVVVPEWLVETPEEKLDAKKIFEIENAEVRREFVRKIGIDRLCYSLGAKTVDEKGKYELLLLDLQDGRFRPYLKMENPSLPDVYHVEGVHPDCNTVEKALNWRNQTAEKPVFLT